MNEVILLEENICNIQKDLSDSQKLLRDGEKEIKRWTDKLENALAVLKLNVNNKSFMKNKATHVDLKEFQNIKEKIEDLQDEVTECNMQLSILNKSRASLLSSLSSNSLLLKKCEDQLKLFCKIIPLNAKT